jgi:hypothetical protein
MLEYPENKSLSPILLAKKPEANPRIAKPPTMNEISTEKLIYKPPIFRCNRKTVEFCKVFSHPKKYTS